MKEFNFTLGVVEKLNIKMESVVAQDINCNKFNIQLVHDASMHPYDLTGATSAIVYFLRSDNLVFQEYATITNHTQGRLEIILAADTFAVSGVAVAEVAIYAGEEMKCTSQTFKFNIRKPLNDGEVYVSGNDLPNYKAEMARLETILENLIITAGDSNPEIVAARYSIADEINFPTLGDRLDHIDAKIENINMTEIEAQIADLAGVGRTTETVKQNADDIAAHEASNASTTQRGHIQLATSAEVIGGADSIKAVTPLGFGSALSEFGYFRRAKNISSTDLNSLTSNGFYSGNNLGNAPDNSFYYTEVIQHGTGDNYIMQRIVGITGNSIGKMYQRVKNSTIWTQWRTIIDSVTITQGENSPEGVVVAPVGTIYLRANGGTNTTLYVKESGTGNVGWIAK